MAMIGNEQDVTKAQSVRARGPILPRNASVPSSLERLGFIP